MICCKKNTVSKLTKKLFKLVVLKTEYHPTDLGLNIILLRTGGGFSVQVTRDTYDSNHYWLGSVLLYAGHDGMNNDSATGTTITEALKELISAWEEK